MRAPRAIRLYDLICCIDLRQRELHMLANSSRMRKRIVFKCEKLFSNVEFSNVEIFKCLKQNYIAGDKSVICFREFYSCS